MDSDLTDEELMEQMAQGNVSAFDTLFQRHGRAVFNYAARLLHNQDAADDVTQECFLRVWRARLTYQPLAQFRTWLFTIARRLALTELVRRQEHPTLLATDLESEGYELTALDIQAGAAAANPQSIVVAWELARVMENAITALPAELREVVLLRETEAMSYEQIAGIVGCPVGTVKSRLNTARRRLQAAALEWMGDKRE